MSLTGTLSVGFTGSKSWFTSSVPGIVWLIPVVGSVTVAVPSSPTVTFLPGFFALTLSSTCFFSSGVKCALSLTGTLSVGFTGVKSLTVKSLTGITLDWPVFGSVIVTFPLSSTLTSIFGLDFLTFFSNSVFSSGVKCSGSGTTIGSGISTSNSLAGSPLALVSLPGIVISLVPSFGSLPSSWAIPFPVVGFSGNSLLVNSTFPPVTTFSLAIPGNLTLVPSGTPSTVTSTFPVCGFCVPTVNVGVDVDGFSTYVTSTVCGTSFNVTVLLPSSAGTYTLSPTLISLGVYVIGSPWWCVPDGTSISIGDPFVSSPTFGWYFKTVEASFSL